MKTTLLLLLLTGMVSTALAENPRPAKRSSANARKATTGKPLPPPRPERTSQRS